MPFGEQTRQTLDQFSQMLPLWVDVSLGFVILWGVFLWLFGSRLMRPSLAMIGLVGGAVLAGLYARHLESNEQMAMVIIGAGVAGGILTWVTFRLWVALLLAIGAAIIAPCVVLVMEGATAPERVDDPLRDAAREVTEDGLAAGKSEDDKAAAAAPTDAEAQAGDSAEEDVLAQTKADVRRLLERLVEAVRQSADELRVWWNEEVDVTVRRTATGVAGVMAITGLIVGLVMPQLAAGLVTSLLGAGLVLACAGRLLHNYAPPVADIWPDTPRGVMTTLAVATVLGGLLQWWSARRAKRGQG